MRGPYVLLILVVGWVIMYFVLTLSVPEHLREQTDEMPGTRKSTPLVEGSPAPEEGAPKTPAPPGEKSQSQISLLFSAPKGGESLGVVIVELFRNVRGRQMLDLEKSIFATGSTLEHSLAVSDPAATYTLRAVSQAEGRPLWGPVTLEGLKTGSAPVEVRFPAKR